MSLGNEDNLENRCREFCQCFISSGIVAIRNYNDEAIGRKEKTAKWMPISEFCVKSGFQTVGAAIGATTSLGFSGLTGAKGGSFAGTIANKGINAVFLQNHKEKAKKISERLSYFNFGTNVCNDLLIEVLSHVAVQIFASFEWQFMLISGDWKHSMHKLALDAVDRTMSYMFSQNLPPLQNDLELKEVLIKGVIYGKSKGSVFSKITPDFLQGLHVGSMGIPHPGKTLQSIDDKINSCYFWAKPGVIDKGKFFYSDHCDLDKYGYRRFFQFEENIADFPHESIGIGDDYEYKIYKDIEKYKNDLMQFFASSDAIIANTVYKKITENLSDFVKIVIEELKIVIASLLTPPSPTLDEHWIGKFWPQKNCLINSFVIRVLENGKPIVDHIKEKIDIAREFVITGCVGVGKSTLAKWFLDEYEKCFDNIIWIDCRNEKYLRACIAGLAASLKIVDPDKKLLPALTTEIYQKFQSKECLFIFDGAADYATLKSVLPNKNISNKIISLITSRHDVWGQQSDFGKIECFKLECFSDMEAVKFVTSEHALGNLSSISDVQELARTLQNHPLALRISVACIKELKEIDSSYDVPKCLADFKSNPQTILEAQKLDDYNQCTISNAFMKTYEDIKARNGELALTILAIIAYLNCDAINYDLFYELGEVSMVHNAISLLKNYSFIKIICRQKKCFSVCPLFQLVIMLVNKSDEEEHLKKALTCLDNSKFPDMHLDKVFSCANNYPNLCEEFKLLKDKLKQMTPIGCGCPKSDINNYALALTNVAGKLKE